MTVLEFRKLTKLLLDIKNHLARIGIKRDSTADHPQPQPAPVVTVNTVLEIPVAIREYYESKNKHRWGNRLKNLLEIAAVGVAVWLAFLNRGVLNEIQEQTPKIIESADAAKRAADTAALTVRLDERAWLIVRYPAIPMNVGSRISVPLTFENTGKTTAKNLVGVIAVSITDAGAKPDFTYVRGYYSWNSGYLPQNTPDTQYWNALDRKTRKDIILTGPINDSVRSGKSVVTINGRIEYDDIFKVHHWIAFCEQTGAPTNGMQISGNADCAAYNQIDTNQ